MKLKITRKQKHKKTHLLLIMILIITFIRCQNHKDRGALDGSTGSKEEQETGPLILSEGPYFFFDSLLLAKKEGVELKVNIPEKYEANPILPGKNPYADIPRATGPFTILPQEKGDGYRMWYLPNGGPFGFNIGYGISEDGIHWELPDLGIVELGGNKINNMILQGALPGRVYMDSHASNPDENYKAIFYRNQPQPVGFSVSTSQDGLHWKTPVWIEELDDRKEEGIQGQGASDIVDFFYDQNTEEWVAIFKMWSLEGQYDIPVKRGHPAPRCGRRIIGMSRSKDFYHWSKAKQILLPDGQDPPTLEFYGMRSFLYRGGWYISFVPCLIDDASPDGIGWTELVISRDGNKWQRIRQTFLDRSFDNNNAPDHAMAWITEVISVGDQEYIYFSGYDAGHKIGNRTGCLAFVKKNRFVGMSTVSEHGMIETNPVILPKSKEALLLLNVDSNGGEVRVQLSVGSEVLEGYSFSDCDPVTVNSIAVPVSWKGKTNLPQIDDQVKIEFKMTNARLFTIEVSE